MQEENWGILYQGEGLLLVSVQYPEGEGAETSLVIQSLQAALEKCIRLDEQSRIESPSPAAV